MVTPGSHHLSAEDQTGKTSENPATGPVLDYATPRKTETAKVATFTDSFEANLARAKLEAEGIQCFVGGEMSAGTLSGYGPGFSKQDIFVDKTDEAAARRVLEEIAASRVARRGGLDRPTCPACGSSDTRATGIAWIVWTVMAVGIVGTYMTGSLWWLMLSLPALYLIFTMDRTRWRCAACRHRWATTRAPRDSEDDSGS
jgi:hypothetical protein